MIFVYDHSDYKIFLQDLADRFSGTFDGITMTFPPDIAEGYLRLVELPGGLQVILSNYTMKEEFTFFRIASLPEIFHFRADYIDNSDGLQINMGDNEFTVASQVYTNVTMFSTRYNAKVSIQKGAKLLGLAIMLKKEWLEKYFSQKLLSFWINHTHVLRSNNLKIIPIDFDARQSFFSLLNLDVDDATYLFHVQVRILEMLDYYFEQVSTKMKNWKNSNALLEDIGKLTELDIFFTKKILEKGEIASIDDMAKHAGMSTTKLKTFFKKVYMQSIGDYFSSCRLNMASKMLLSDKLSIKEVSAKLGFNSVPHFTTAFKNQFGHTPASLFKTEML
jgi:AraC-like DNA-binding protein